jgi:cell division protein FtsB
MGSSKRALSLWLGAIIIYLVAHALSGRQGLLAYVELQARERALEARLDALDQERASLQARVARLQWSTLDLDYLDERARLTLAAGRDDELVFALAP